MIQQEITQHFSIIKNIKRGRAKEGPKAELPKQPLREGKQGGKIELPSSKVQGLSRSTLKVIEGLKCCTSSVTVEDVFTGVTMKEKFGSLLDPERALPLPCHYNSLLEVFRHLDNTINVIRGKKMRSGLGIVKRAVEGASGREMNIKDIERIVYLFPEAYGFTWEDELVIDFTTKDNEKFSCFELAGRKDLFRKKLVELVKTFHRDFVQGLDPEEMRTWHSEFKLHEVPEVPLAKISELKKNEKVSEGVAVRSGRLEKLSEDLKVIYKRQRLPSVFLCDLIKTLQKAQRFPESKGVLEKDIKELVFLFRGWLILEQTGSGEVVRMNKGNEISLSLIKSKLIDKYK